MGNTGKGTTRVHPVSCHTKIVINDAPETPWVHLALFADDMCLYTIDDKGGYVLIKAMQPHFNVIMV
jgi:hypothetical protein